MKISIDNQTRWSTADLRALYRGALKAAGATAGGHLRVGNGRRRGFVGGHCFYGNHRRPGAAAIFIPSPEYCLRHGLNAADLRNEVAQVMHHEALHGVGAKHRDMTEEQRFCNQKIDWAKNLPLNVEPTPERRAATPADRLGHARSMLAKAVTRSKRAATIEKKWARRVKMLERKGNP